MLEEDEKKGYSTILQIMVILSNYFTNKSQYKW